MPHGGSGAAAFLVGPAVLTLLLAVLASVALVGYWSGRVGPLRALGERARAGCARRRVASVLWGLSAGALVFAVSAVLIQTHVLALFGVLFLLAGVVVLSFGVGIAAWAVGDALTTAVDGDGGDWHSLKAGLALLLLASCLPLVGWLLCLVSVSAGVGSVLETLVARE